MSLACRPAAAALASYATAGTALPADLSAAADPTGADASCCIISAIRSTAESTSTRLGTESTCHVDAAGVTRGRVVRGDTWTGYRQLDELRAAGERMQQPSHLLDRPQVGAVGRERRERERDAREAARELLHPELRGRSDEDAAHLLGRRAAQNHLKVLRRRAEESPLRAAIVPAVLSRSRGAWPKAYLARARLQEMDELGAVEALRPIARARRAVGPAILVLIILVSVE